MGKTCEVEKRVSCVKLKFLNAHLWKTLHFSCVLLHLHCLRIHADRVRNREYLERESSSIYLSNIFTGVAT